MFSFSRQEYEAASLASKIRVCSQLAAFGVRAVNLQHDGLVVVPGTLPTADLLRAMQSASSATLGYTQPVAIKDMELATDQTNAPPPVAPLVPRSFDVDGVEYSYDDACAYPLHFNLRRASAWSTEDGPERSRRAAAAALEKRLIAWCKRTSATHVSHILDSSRRGFMSELDAQLMRWRQADAAELSSLIAALPRGVREAISRGPQPLRQGSWVSDAHGNFYNVAEDARGPLVSLIPCHLNSTLGTLSRAGAACAVPVASVTPCRVWEKETRGTPEEEKEKKTAREEMRAPACPVHCVFTLAARSLHHAPFEPCLVGARYHTTTRGRRPSVTMEGFRTCDVKAILTSREWSTPRLFAAPGGLLAASLEAVGTSSEQELQQTLRRAHASILPRRLRELCYKVITGGFLMGERKGGAGDKRYCKCCMDRAPHAGGLRVRTWAVRPEWFETVLHVFHTCPRARGLWKLVLAWWQGSTGEALACTERVTMLGTRTPAKPDWGEDQHFEDLEQPWCLLRAIVLDVLWRERGRYEKASKSRSSQSLFRMVQREFCKYAQARLAMCNLHERACDDCAPAASVAPAEKQQQRAGQLAVSTFERQWLESGLLRRVGRKPFRGSSEPNATSPASVHLVPSFSHFATTPTSSQPAAGPVPPFVPPSFQGSPPLHQRSPCLPVQQVRQVSPA